MVVARTGTPANQQGDHPGLIAQRFALKKEEGENDDVKAEALNRAVNALTNARNAYRPAFELWEKSFESTSDNLIRRYVAEFKSERRMVVGLGADSVIETGVALSHTYGVPYIPGSSIKGMTSSYCHEYYGCNAKQDEFKEGGSVHRAIFGSQDESGVVVFHDAWIEPNFVQNSLKLDVMTPHHTAYNGGGSEPPSDFDSPNPVLFLSVVGKFRLYLTIEERVDDESARVALDFASKLVDEAFRRNGIGGKKSSGYGFADVKTIAKKEIPVVAPKKGDVRTLKRVQPEVKGELLFKDVETGKKCIILKGDQKEVKKQYPLDAEGSFVFIQVTGDDKWQFKLPPQN